MPVVELRHVPRARVNLDTRGLFKIVAEQGPGKVLGVHALGDNAGDVILAGVYAVKLGLIVTHLAETWRRASRWRRASSSPPRASRPRSSCSRAVPREKVARRRPPRCSHSRPGPRVSLRQPPRSICCWRPVTSAKLTLFGVFGGLLLAWIVSMALRLPPQDGVRRAGSGSSRWLPRSGRAPMSPSRGSSKPSRR